MSRLEVFDPAMCCSTGICGPEVDPALPRFAADLDWLSAQGVEVFRHNLSQQPAAFAENEEVKAALGAQGLDCLPLVLLDGKVLSMGAYPSREQLATRTAQKPRVPLGSRPACVPKADGSSCC